MAKKSMILKQQREPKFSTRQYNRCKLCGRPHAYLHLPYLLPRAGLQGPDPRREEGLLVRGALTAWQFVPYKIFREGAKSWPLPKESFHALTSA